MSENLELYLSQAVQFLEGSRPLEAMRILDQAIAEFSNDPRGWQLRGGVHHRMGDTQTAAEDLEQARALGSLCHCATLALIDSHRRNGDTFSAREIAEEMAEDLALPISVLAPLACSLGLLGEFSTALVVCETIVERQHTAHAAYFGIAFYRSRLEFTSRQILPFVQRALELEPSNSVYAANAGLLHLEIGEEEQGWAILDAIPPQAVRCPSIASILCERYQKARRMDFARDWSQRRKELSQQRDAVNSHPTATSNPHCCIALPLQ